MRSSALAILVLFALMSSSLGAAEPCAEKFKLLKKIGRKFDAGISGLGRSGIYIVKKAAQPIRWSFGTKRRAIITASILGVTVGSLLPIIPTQEGQTAAYPFLFQKVRDRFYRGTSNEEQMKAFEEMRKRGALPAQYEDFPQGVDLFNLGEKP